MDAMMLLDNNNGHGNKNVGQLSKCNKVMPNKVSKRLQTVDKVTW